MNIKAVPAPAACFPAMPRAGSYRFLVPFVLWNGHFESEPGDCIIPLHSFPRSGNVSFARSSSLQFPTF
jgi:hypothetical protein